MRKKRRKGPAPRFSAASSSAGSRFASAAITVPVLGRSIPKLLKTALRAAANPIPVSGGCAILLDVKAVTASVNQQTERVNHAISGTMERVDETADRVKGSVRDRVNQAVGIVQGLRAVVLSVLGHDGRHEPPSPAAGRV